METISDKPTRIIVNRIVEKEGEKPFGGMIFSSCIYIQDHAIVLTDEKGIVEGIFSLNHYYFTKD